MLCSVMMNRVVSNADSGLTVIKGFISLCAGTFSSSSKFFSHIVSHRPLASHLSPTSALPTAITDLLFTPPSITMFAKEKKKKSEVDDISTIEPTLLASAKASIPH